MRDLPRERALARLAREIAAASPERVGGATALRLEVWRTQFDPRTLEPKKLLLREQVVPLP